MQRLWRSPEKRKPDPHAGLSYTLDMISCQFIFAPGEYDERFHELDASIDAFAQSLEGYVGVDRWVSIDGTSRNSIYYFADAETVKTFSRFPHHLEAKNDYRQWYEGYQIVVGEVKAIYGDGRLAHILNADSPEMKRIDVSRTRSWSSSKQS